MSCRDPDILALRNQIDEHRVSAVAARRCATYTDSAQARQAEERTASDYERRARELEVQAATLALEYKRTVRLLSIALSQTAAAEGLSDDQADERADAIIHRHTGGRTTSRTETTAAEREAILAELKAGGWQPTVAAGRRGRQRLSSRSPKAPESRREQIWKIRAQLAELGKDWAYARGILRNLRGIADKTVACPLESATDAELSAVIGALDRTVRFAKRKGKSGEGR